MAARRCLADLAGHLAWPTCRQHLDPSPACCPLIAAPPPISLARTCSRPCTTSTHLVAGMQPPQVRKVPMPCPRSGHHRQRSPTPRPARPLHPYRLRLLESAPTRCLAPRTFPCPPPSARLLLLFRLLPRPPSHPSPAESACPFLPARAGTPPPRRSPPVDQAPRQSTPPSTPSTSFRGP